MNTSSHLQRACASSFLLARTSADSVQSLIPDLESVVLFSTRVTAEPRPQGAGRTNYTEPEVAAAARAKASRVAFLLFLHS